MVSLSAPTGYKPLYLSQPLLGVGSGVMGYTGAPVSAGALDYFSNWSHHFKTLIKESLAPFM